MYVLCTDDCLAAIELLHVLSKHRFDNLCNKCLSDSFGSGSVSLVPYESLHDLHFLVPVSAEREITAQDANYKCVITLLCSNIRRQDIFVAPHQYMQHHCSFT